jgi:putative peptidoglycan lipid II flippase
MASEDDASELVLGAATDDLPGAERPGAASAGRSANLVMVGIVLSRVFGLARERLVGHYFGLSGFADVAAAAFRIGNITQNLLGEGTLSASFIPVYARLRAGGKGREAVAFARTALGFLMLLAAAASAIGALASPLLTRLIATGVAPDHFDAAVRAVRVLFPMTGLLVLSAWALGVLNAHRRFFLSYAAPVLWSLSQIAALALFGGVLGQHDEPLMMALAGGATLGAVLQLVVLLPAARALLGRITPRFDRADPNLHEAARRLPGVLLGRGVIQISGLIDAALVGLCGGEGGLAAFAKAQLLYLLPMSLLGTGEAAASLPEMAGDTADENLERRNASIRARLGASLARVTVLTVPATLALVFLGGEAIRVLLQSGSFDQAATLRVERLLGAYAFALLGNASGRVLTTTMYAMGDTRTPARYAIYRVVASTVSALVLMQSLDALGVVLGAVIAAWVETFALAYKLRQKLGGLGLSQIPFARAAALGALSTLPPVALRAALPEAFAASFVGASILLLVFAGAFAAAAPALGLFNLRSLLGRLRRR